jgi:hypothetical protein
MNRNPLAGEKGKMNEAVSRRRRLAVSAVLWICLIGTLCAQAQAPQGQATQGQAAAAPAPPPTPEKAAPIDLTGYWVSVVTEDWRWRMVTPAKGDYASIPINVASKKFADGWDPAKDEAAGEQCRSYGAPAVMRVPERIHITWQDEHTLKVETDAGKQTRLFHFGDWKAPVGPATWQGDSVAQWESPRTRRGDTTSVGSAGGQARPNFGDLKVVTTHLRPGYLRKNGVPYSDKTTLTEYWDLSTEHYLSGSHLNEQWIVITTVVSDPVYLMDDWITSLNFKKEPDGSKWDPQPCSARW